jgi:hypothetical protein
MRKWRAGSAVDVASPTAACVDDQLMDSAIRALTDVNAMLAPLQTEIESTCSAPLEPVILIVGPPRSGTTLVSQLLAASGRVGYVSNFIARFWLAPAVGARIERSLEGIGDVGHRIDFDSTYGRTSGWKQPHEFGRFWDGWFNFGQETHWVDDELRKRVDANGLRRSVASLEREYSQPMVFKNNTWCTFQADLLAGIFPTAVVVACTRDPLYVAQSLLLGRRRLLGDDTRWWSVRPRRFAWIRRRPPLEQVALQAVHIDREMRDSLAGVDDGRIVWTPYASVCADPIGTVARIFDAAGIEAGYSLPDVLPERLEHTNRCSLDRSEFEYLERMIAEIQVGTWNNL